MNPAFHPYAAPRWLPGGHLQTIYASLVRPPRVPMERVRWESPDGDFIDVDFTGDPGAKRLLVLFHGLEGGADSHYARALAAAAPAAGWRFAIPHFRGCSGELNRKPRAYHSGDSGEIDWMLRRFQLLNENLFATGVSLGGNALLKWLGEQGDAARAVVRRAAAVSAPLDLTAAGPALDRGANRLLYTRHFLKTLIPKSLAKLERFPGIFDGAQVRAATSFREFDGLVTAPLHGYRDVHDYWTRASSAPWLEHIRVPTLVLNARNDPFLPEAALIAATRHASPSVVLELPRSGGHVGFPGRGFPGRGFPGPQAWLPQRLLAFLAE